MKNAEVDGQNRDMGLSDLIKGYIEKYSRPASEIILDDVDLRELLKISRRTALEYRKKKIILSRKIEGKIYYFLSEVIEGIKMKGGADVL